MFLSKTPMPTRSKMVMKLSLPRDRVKEIKEVFLQIFFDKKVEDSIEKLRLKYSQAQF